MITTAEMVYADMLAHFPGALKFARGGIGENYSFSRVFFLISSSFLGVDVTTVSVQFVFSENTELDKFIIIMFSSIRSLRIRT